MVMLLLWKQKSKPQKLCWICLNCVLLAKVTGFTNLMSLMLLCCIKTRNNWACLCCGIKCDPWQEVVGMSAVVTSIITQYPLHQSPPTSSSSATDINTKCCTTNCCNIKDNVIRGVSISYMKQLCWYSLWLSLSSMARTLMHDLPPEPPIFSKCGVCCVVICHVEVCVVDDSYYHHIVSHAHVWCSIILVMMAAA